MSTRNHLDSGSGDPLGDLRLDSYTQLPVTALDTLGLASGGAVLHLPPTPSAFGLSDEVAFVSGVNADGTLPLFAFSAWNNDTPATYTGGFTNTAKWGAPAAHTAGGTVLYYFDPASNWTATEKSFLAAGLSLWSDVANISFAATTNASQAQIDFVRGHDGQAQTSPTETDPGGGGVTGGSVLLQLTKATVSIDTSVTGFGPIGNFTAQGGYPIMTFLHEEGHSIGLGHAGPYNGDVDPATQQFSPYDTRLWTIMSYIEPSDASAQFFGQYPVQGTQWGVGHSGFANEPTGLMPLDIQAAQALYGAPTTTPLSGGQIFGFDCNVAGPTEMFFDFTKNTTPILTLFDTGTGNTLDLSGYATAAQVDLVAGTFSSFDGMTNNMAIAAGTAIDKFVGGAGNDFVTGNSDGDTFIGGGGDDTFDGGSGSDTAVFSGPRADYTITMGSAPVVTDDRAGSPDGTVHLEGVEFAKFSDQTVALLAGDAPVLGGTGVVGYVEQAAAVAVAPGLTLSDAAGAAITGATVQIASGFVAGDTLNFAAQNGITGSFDAAQHELFLSGTATAAQYQAALRSVIFSSASDDPTAGGNDTSRTLAYTASTADSASTDAPTSTINVTAVNDAPHLAGAANTVAYTEQAAPVVLDGAIAVTDVDNATLAGATVTIAGGFVAGDLLNFANQNGIAGSYNAATHVLTLSGSASVANYQAALRSVSFSSASDNPTNFGASPARTITWTVDDGQASNHVSAAATTTLALTAVNDAPVLGGAGNTLGFAENGGPVALDRSITVSDADTQTLTGATVTIASGFVAGDTLTSVNLAGITGSYNAATHVLSLSGTSSVANYQIALRSVSFFTASDNPDNFGAAPTRTITWTVDDGQASNHVSAAATTTLAVAAVNDAPRLGGAGNTLSFAENGGPVALDRSITVSDADSATLTGATVTIASGFVAGDTLSSVNLAGITGSYNAATHVLTLSGTSSVANYQIALRSVSFFTASDNPDNFGASPARTISWTVDDGQASNHVSAAAATTLDIAAVNDAPRLGGAGNTLSFAENGGPVALDRSITVSDADTQTLTGATVTIASGFVAGDTLTSVNLAGITGSYNAATHVLTLSGTSSVANYQIALRSVSFFTASDNPDNFGAAPTRTITWTVDDGQASNHVSAAATTTLDIAAVNDAPVLGGAGNTIGYTAHGGPIALDRGITVSDVDSKMLTGATVTITSGFVAGDTLTSVDLDGITGHYDAVTHTLTLTGAASVGSYQIALRSVSFSSSSADPANAGANPSRTIAWTVDDGQSANHASAAATTTVSVAAAAPHLAVVAAPDADHFVFAQSGPAAVPSPIPAIEIATPHPAMLEDPVPHHVAAIVPQLYEHDPAHAGDFLFG